MPFSLIQIFVIIPFSGDSDSRCEPVPTAPDFNLSEYVQNRWYVHQQAPTKYVPIEKNYCSYAEYDIRESPTYPWGYTVKVNNYAEDKDGNSFGGELCAYEADKKDKAKLGVAPCWLPKSVAGPYWVLAYDEEEGYAFVSGGQPNIWTGHGCKTGDGVLESGLWIFLRTRKRNHAKVKKVREIAKAMGFDLSVLNDVDQTNCAENHANTDTSTE